MKALRPVALVALFAVAVAAAWFVVASRRPAVGDTVTVYYTKNDGTTEVPWRVSLGAARDLPSVAFYVATQAVAGPPPGVDAVRFPPGTRVLSATVAGSTATVDLSSDVDVSAQGGLLETGEFKGLVWTMTSLPGISAVSVHVNGRSVATLPGGHLELDEPLSRASV
jgi:spore germination protein GerM